MTTVIKAQYDLHSGVYEAFPQGDELRRKRSLLEWKSDRTTRIDSTNSYANSDQVNVLRVGLIVGGSVADGVGTNATTLFIHSHTFSKI